jgi:hypothetical protein
LRNISPADSHEDLLAKLSPEGRAWLESLS